MKRTMALAVFLTCCSTVLPLMAVPDDEPVTVAYQLIYNPWKVPMARGEFEKATGRKVVFRKFDTPAKVLAAMASGQVDIGLLGSTGVTTAFARGLDVELFWIVEGIASAEALVVRNGSGIQQPADLVGKKLGVPFVSTTHFHTLVALEHFGLDPRKVQVINMNPNAIAAAWTRGDIDAAFVWNPALGRIKDTGKVLITSGELGELGKPTFDGLVALTDFAAENRQFMVSFVKVMAAADAAYRNNAAAWTADSQEIRDIVKMVGGNAADVPEVLASYEFPTLEQQASCAWLGCGDEGGAAKAVLATADFLKEQHKIPRVADSYASFINDSFVKAALESQP